MTRAHFIRPVQDNFGTTRTGVIYRVMKPGTNELIDGLLRANDTNTDVLPNPCTLQGGVIDFYLDTPQRVRLGIRVPGEPEVFYDNIDVILPFDKTVSTALEVTFTPAGTIAAQNVQAALEELDAEKSPIGHTHVIPPSNPFKSTHGPGLPATGQRTEGDLHYDETAKREYIAVPQNNYGTTYTDIGGNGANGDAGAFTGGGPSHQQQFQVSEAVRVAGVIFAARNSTILSGTTYGIYADDGTTALGGGTTAVDTGPAGATHTFATPIELVPGTTYRVRVDSGNVAVDNQPPIRVPQGVVSSIGGISVDPVNGTHAVSNDANFTLFFRLVGATSTGTTTLGWVSTDEYVATHTHTGLGTSADKVSFAPGGQIAATDVQQALLELDSEKATPAYAQSAASTAVQAHEAATDPHPQYLTTSEGTALVTAHEAATDPHPQYLTQTEGDGRYVQPSQVPAANTFKSTTAAGLPTTNGRSIGDLHFDETAQKEHVLQALVTPQTIAFVPGYTAVERNIPAGYFGAGQPGEVYVTGPANKILGFQYFAGGNDYGQGGNYYEDPSQGRYGNGNPGTVYVTWRWFDGQNVVASKGDTTILDARFGTLSGTKPVPVGTPTWVSTDEYVAPHTHGSAFPARTTGLVTTPDNLANGATWEGTIPLAVGYRLYRITTDKAVRVRLYTRNDRLVADRSRAAGVDPAVNSNSGLMLDFTTTSSLLAADLAPLVDGVNLENAPSVNIPISITNNDVSGPVTVTFTYLRTE